ncbi:class I SAM-dependent methyltransferase [Leifsonia virtsii]|uniref:Class I SAM-dependent methyltransferase n=1 Tax=Leifsonia virtsii TaxID=3035915 RepID=A0ABT8IYZ2_9MICO|nr:class I SAM-dependent methyltransferase [Leifsonia virtsii]MDN4597269.1 class I SAM-dependent methyltransferase [Leifsonia virtsii]
MSSGVRDAYARRSAEYIDLFGSMEPVHPADLQLVTTWADSLEGPVIDAGCGPGQWTDHLASRGKDVSGVDLVPEFISRARRSYPGVRFDVGGFDRLDAETSSIGGVLSWYSLIHREPDDIRAPLREFARVLRPGAGLLVGFFTWPTLERFPHAVVDGYRWPVPLLASEVEAAGFDVVETYERTQSGARPQGAIVARRRSGQ